MTATAAPPRSRTTPRTGVLVVGIVVVAAVLLGAVTVALRGPAMVDQVVVENHSAVPVTVLVSSGNDQSVLPLGTVGGASTFRFQQVLDQGGTWTFHLSVGPDELGQITRTRAQLEADAWSVVVPHGIGSSIPAARR